MPSTLPMIPLIGGQMLFLGFYCYPGNTMQNWAWLAFLIDYGSIPGIVLSLYKKPFKIKPKPGFEWIFHIGIIFSAGCAISHVLDTTKDPKMAFLAGFIVFTVIFLPSFYLMIKGYITVYYTTNGYMFVYHATKWYTVISENNDIELNNDGNTSQKISPTFLITRFSVACTLSILVGVDNASKYNVLSAVSIIPIMFSFVCTLFDASRHKATIKKQRASTPDKQD
jgi:hypothetical protein